MQSDPDMLDVEDLKDGMRHLLALVDADGVRTPAEDKVVALFTGPVLGFTSRTNARIALETIHRAGANRYTRTKAQDAGLTVVVSIDGYVLDVALNDTDDTQAPQEAA